MPVLSWKTTAGKNPQSRGLMALCFVIFLVYLAQAVYMAIVPLYLADQGYDPAGVGIVVFANLIASSALSIPFGVVSDRVGRKKTVAFGTAVAALGSALFLHGSVQSSILAYTLLGVGHGAYGPGTQAYPVDIALGKDLARAIGWSQSVRQAAMVIGPVIGYFVKAGMGYETTFVTGTSLMAVGLLAALMLLPKVRVESTLRKSAETSDPGPVRTLGGPILAFLCVVLSASFAFGTFQAFIPLYASKNGFATQTIGFIFAAQAIAGIVSRTAVGELLRRTGRQTVIVAVFMLMGSMALAAVGAFRTLEPIMALAAILGFAQGSAIVTSALALATLADERRRGFVMAFFNTMLYAGLGIGPALIGQVIAVFGFQAGFEAASLAPILGVAALLTARRKADRKSDFS